MRSIVVIISCSLGPTLAQGEEITQGHEYQEGGHWEPPQELLTTGTLTT